MYWINLCIPWESKDTAHLKEVIKEVIKRSIKDVAYLYHKKRNPWESKNSS